MKKNANIFFEKEEKKYQTKEKKEKFKTLTSQIDVSEDHQDHLKYFGFQSESLDKV